MIALVTLNMAEQSGVEFIEEWQTGAFLIVLSVSVGVALVAGFGSVILSTPVAILSVFVVGAVAAFLLSSYLIYGR